MEIKDCSVQRTATLWHASVSFPKIKYSGLDRYLLKWPQIHRRKNFDHYLDSGLYWKNPHSPLWTPENKQTKKKKAQKEYAFTMSASLSSLLLLYISFFFLLLFAFQGRTCGTWRVPGQGRIGATAASLPDSHSNARSKPHL